MRERQTVIAVILAAFIGMIIKTAHTSNDIETVQYTKCPKGFETEHAVYSAPGRSPLDCIQRCSQTNGCSGVNICPTGLHRKVVCGLAEVVQPGICAKLSAAASPSCYYAQKVQMSIDIG